MAFQSNNRWRSLAVAALLGLGMGWAQAQSLKVEPAQDEVPPAASAAQPAGQTGGIRSANIFEIAPSADTDPNYASQTNAER